MNDIVYYQISNLNKMNHGSDTIIYNKNKYPICVGYDNNRNVIQFAIAKHDVPKDKLYFIGDPNNYWDIFIGLMEFRIVNIYNNYQENRDFFTDDIKTIRVCFDNHFKRKFTNEYIYILNDNYFISFPEFGDDTDKILGIFIKKICKNLPHYLRALKEVYPETKEFGGSVYDTKSHKYLSDVFIALRHGYEDDPDTIETNEYVKVDNALEKKFTDMGFVSINDFTGFENSHGFVFINPTSNKELIYFYKMLYNDKKNLYYEMYNRKSSQ